jgi:DNA-binding LytR/AlgR family response regulator
MFSENIFFAGINRFKNLNTMSLKLKNDVLFVSVDRGKQIVHVKKNKIFYCEAMDNHVKLITDDDKMFVYQSTFVNFLGQMSTVDSFARVHRSYAIRLDYIAETFPTDLYAVLEEKFKKILAGHLTADEVQKNIRFGKEYMERFRRLIGPPEYIQGKLDLR